MLNNDQVREHAHQVLQGEDFQQYVAKEQSFDWLQWLIKHLNWKFSFETDGNNQILGLAFKIILITIIIAFVIYAISLVYKKFFSNNSDAKKTDGIKITDQQRQQTRQSYTHLSFEALHNEDYRKAIHYLFLASVSMVIKEAFFNKADYMTNREIAKESDFSRLISAKNLKSIFYDMVHFDEPYWFGSKKATRHDYDKFYEYYNSFKDQVNPNDS